MKKLFLVLVLVNLVGCAGLMSWLQSDAGGDPTTGPTRGEVAASTTEAASGMAGPFGAIGLLLAAALRGISRRKQDA